MIEDQHTGEYCPCESYRPAGETVRPGDAEDGLVKRIPESDEVFDYFAQAAGVSGMYQLDDIYANSIFDAMKVAVDRLQETEGAAEEMEGTSIQIRVWRSYGK